MHKLYLLVDLFTILVPLLVSFHPRVRFYKTWKAFFAANILASSIFLAWDILFTSRGIWGFNPRYITGVYVVNLPVEEVLFFICVPFSCVFTYCALGRLHPVQLPRKVESVFFFVFSTFLLLAGLVYLARLYTSVTFLGTALLCIFLKKVLKIDWFGGAVVTYLILLIPFLIVNGILTGAVTAGPVVYYNNQENVGARIFTIPVEDVVYGFGLFILHVSLYLFFVKKLNNSPIS